MTLAENGKRWMDILLLSLPFFVPASVSVAKTKLGAHEGRANDVVILALEPLNARVDLRQHVREGLEGSSEARRDTDKELLEIQMTIVREIAQFGPVLLLAPDESTKYAVSERCHEFGICELLRNDRVRITTVPHDAVWIRDFGPQIRLKAGSAHVQLWRYFDIRAEQAKQDKFQELETARLKLLSR